jgi:helicase SWR1
VKTPSALPHDDGPIWDILGFSHKGKGKDRDSRSPKTTKGKASSVSGGTGTSLATMHEPQSVPVAAPRLTRQATSRASLPKMPSPVASGPIQPGKESLVGKTRRRQSLDATSDVHLAAPRKRRKTDIHAAADLLGSPPIGSPAKTTRARPLQSTPPPPTRKATLNGVHQITAAKISPGPLADKGKGLTPVASTPPIRRIRLIVRAPEPVYTNPKQKPTLPIFNKSVASVLASYTRLESDDVDEDALVAEARERAALLESVYALRQQGRMLLSAEDAGRALQTRPMDPRTIGADPWDHILDAVRARHRQRETSGPEIAATIAAKVRMYWDLQNAKEGKVKLQQEKQLRALAKTTLKLVIAEWKKAVFVSDSFGALARS